MSAWVLKGCTPSKDVRKVTPTSFMSRFFKVGVVLNSAMTWRARVGLACMVAWVSSNVSLGVGYTGSLAQAAMRILLIRPETDARDIKHDVHRPRQQIVLKHPLRQPD